MLSRSVIANAGTGVRACANRGGRGAQATLLHKDFESHAVFTSMKSLPRVSPISRAGRSLDNLPGKFLKKNDVVILRGILLPQVLIMVDVK